MRQITDRSDVPGWQIRVVPNKFPALQVEGELNPKGYGHYDMMNGVGAHEVIIETPNHASDLADLSPDEIAQVMITYRDRIVDLKEDSRFKYILIFKNHGSAAGASLEHSHSQLIATPIIPKRVLEELEGSKRFFNNKERCIYCDIIKHEIKARDRLVAQNDSFVAIEPFAPRFPYETWVLPVQHFSNFEHLPEAEFLTLATIMKDILNRINHVLGYPPFNFVLHTAPIQNKALPDYHWHFEIIPKLAKIAGFEWGSGFYINPTTPELAAEQLRKFQASVA